MRLRKIPSHVWMLLCMLVIIIGLAGCVYLRLLEFKNQLDDFDQNFATHVEDSHFVLFFKDPMLYEKDITYLTEVDPSQKDQLGAGEKWVYTFARTSEDEDSEDETTALAGPNLIFTITTNHEDKMNSARFSEVFLEIIPPKFFEYSLRAMGNAEVDTKKRHVYAKIENVDKDMLNLPTREELVEKLGIPNKVEEEENKDYTLLVYKYRLKGTQPTEKKDDPGKAEARLQFNKDSNLLVEVKCQFAGLKLSIDYRKWLNQDKNPIASS